MSDDRFTLGLGAGERLNEHVTGAGWPGTAERHERLSEAIEIIQGLLGAEITTIAASTSSSTMRRLFDRPERKVRSHLAAGSRRPPALAARKSEGLIATEPRRDLIEAYRGAGGTGPCYAEVSVCWAA
ncbi:LLM class flavin-dependent oxidoreductase, partial [Paeniroseomonas aquatica]|uniref:LLM class flavin-dependent oxidoreductase n=1 Tax=Paeniroseomonas aquatica TaxID=373043 RepID=UPI00360902AA